MIERFERRRIESWLRERELKFLINQDGDFVVDFFSEQGHDYRVHLCAEGANTDVLCIHIRPDIIYSETKRDRVEGFVAGWNRKMRWPKAFITDDWRGRGIQVLAENSFPLDAGIHQELLSSFIMVTIDSGRRLIAELAATVDTCGEAELETWLHSTE